MQLLRGRLRCVPERALGLQVFVEPVFAPFAAVAAALVAAERSVQVERMVDGYLAGPDPARQGPR